MSSERNLHSQGQQHGGSPPCMFRNKQQPQMSGNQQQSTNNSQYNNTQQQMQGTYKLYQNCKRFNWLWPEPKNISWNLKTTLKPKLSPKVKLGLKPMRLIAAFF